MRGNARGKAKFRYSVTLQKTRKNEDVKFADQEECRVGNSQVNGKEGHFRSHRERTYIAKCNAS